MAKGTGKRKKDNLNKHDGVKRVKGQCDGDKVEEETVFPQINTRATPRALVKAIGRFNPIQKAAVVNMGFEGLLELKIKDFPPKLTYWLADSFNPASCELAWGSGKSIHVDASDVERVLGFPNGNVKIEKKCRSDERGLLEEWRNIFLKPDKKIKVSEVCTEMLSCKDGGVWFMRHFIALVDCLIIGNNPCGYVNPLIMKCLKDVNNIRNLNWREYTLSTLINSTTKWDKGEKHKYFNGPVLFLCVLYMDRVVFYTRDVPRTLPSFRSWNTEIVRRRTKKELKDGGFGRGFVDTPLLNCAQMEGSTVFEFGRLDKMIIKRKSLDGGPNTEEEYASRLLGKLSYISTEVIDLITLLENVPK